ncbi:nucleotidyltransferase family protein [Gemmatirosa kalamazoonensis]|nr:nucleotidyltransferase family protein [Gemmatirosa kalamazoonensis]
MTDDVAEVQRRLAEFARTRDPAALWPGVTERARVEAARELQRVTRLVLAGERTIVVDGRCDAAALAIAGHTTGMGPVVGRWIEDGVVDAAPAVRDRLARHLDHARRRHARIEREVMPALDALLGAGVTPVLLKGFHTARAYFEEPAVRRMADVDVLVPRDRVADVEAVLRDARYRPDGDAHRPYKRDWIRDDVDPRYHSVELWHAESRWILEVHASLDRRHHPGAVARVDGVRPHLPNGGTIPFPVAGRPLRALDEPLLLLTLACHGSQELDGSRLLRLYELARVIRADRASGRLDWDAVLDLMRRTRLARFAWPALALVEDLAPDTVDPRVLALGRRASTWAARHTVTRLTPAGGALDARGVLRQLMWDRGPVALAQRFLRTMWPAAVTRPGDAAVGWRVRWRRIRAGALSLSAPDERR